MVQMRLVDLEQGRNSGTRFLEVVDSDEMGRSRVLGQISNTDLEVEMVCSRKFGVKK